MKKELKIKKELKEKYQHFSPDIDTKAINSKLRVQRKWHEEKIKSVRQNIDLKNKKILDLGCGSGGLTFKLSKIPGIKIVGVDFNEEAIKFAKKRAKKENKNNLKFITSDAEDLKLKEKFDVIIGFDVLDHCYNYKKTLKNVYKLLKKGGNFFLTVENKNSLWFIIEKLWDLFGDGRNYGETHLICFNEKMLKDELKKVGFRIEKVFTIHNISTFFYLFSEYYPKLLDNFLKTKRLGLTLVINSVKNL